MFVLAGIPSWAIRSRTTSSSSKRLVERIGKLGDDFGRNAFRRKQPRPHAHLVVDAGLLGGRNVRHVSRRFAAETAKALTEPAKTDSATLTDCSHMKSTWPPTRSFKAGPERAIGNQRRLRADFRGEAETRHMRGRADAAMGQLHRAAPLPQRRRRIPSGRLPGNPSAR